MPIKQYPILQARPQRSAAEQRGGRFLPRNGARAPVDFFNYEAAVCGRIVDRAHFLNKNMKRWSPKRTGGRTGWSTRVHLHFVRDTRVHLIPDKRLHLYFVPDKDLIFPQLVGWHDISYEETKEDLTRTIREEMRISKEDATAMREELFEEIDQIAKTRNAELLSASEKEELVLAIVRTARNLSQKNLAVR